MGEVLLYDNFLSPSDFELIQSTMLLNKKESMSFPWLWSDTRLPKAAAAGA